MLAAVSNGRCGVLLNSDYPWRESLNPDLTDIADEETIQKFEEPVPVSELAAVINSQYSNKSIADKIRDFLHQLSLSNEQ